MALCGDVHIARYNYQPATCGGAGGATRRSSLGLRAPNQVECSTGVPLFDSND